MSIRIARTKIDLELTNKDGKVITLRNIALDEKSLKPFRTMLFLAQAEFETLVEIAVPELWYEEVNCVDSVVLRYTPEGDIFVVIKGLGKVVLYELSVEDIKEFYKNVEFDSTDFLVGSPLSGFFVKKITILEDLLVTDKKELAFLVDDFGICAIYHINNPGTLVERDEASAELWRYQTALLPGNVQDCYL